MIMGLYRGLTGAGAPLIAYYLARRRRRGKEDQARFAERLGVAALPRPAGPLVWLHGASVGEALSILPLVARIQSDWQANVLVTTGTVTSAKMLGQRLPQGVIHQYVPVDRLPYVRRFLNHWQPDLALWVESEFWPNLMAETARREIPALLLNGRISDRSLRGWQRAPGFIRQLLAGFDRCLGQTQEDARRLQQLGARRAVSVGNLKFAALPLPVDELALAEFMQVKGERPAWLAASTHRGDEEVVAAVHRKLQPRAPGLLSVIVPRHPHRAAGIAEDLRRQGMSVAQRSLGEPITAETQIYLADTMGELGLFYRAVPIAFIGKSLVGEGGQNPLEPARLGCAVLFGPHMSNFREIAARMVSSRAALQIADEAELTAKIGSLLGDAAAVEAMGLKAREVAETEAGCLDLVIEILRPYLDSCTGGNDARA